MCVIVRVAALVATKNRWDLLTGAALPAIRQQIRPPDHVIIVNDGATFCDARRKELCGQLSPVPVIVCENARSAGAAGAWNTGLQVIDRTAPDSYVAILDDDDTWDADHLLRNEDEADNGIAEIVVSGLRIQKDGLACERGLPADLTERDFFVGNPGWQGSNTFVSMQLMKRVGGFRDGLKSLNDRDLAIRLLRVKGARVAYTGAWTSTWHVRSGLESLSSRRSEAKLSGARWFWRLYGWDMTADEAARFFERMRSLFGIERGEICCPGSDVPRVLSEKGSLDAQE